LPASRWNAIDSGGKIAATLTTDVNGMYLFFGLVPGSYQVEFILPAGFVFAPQGQGRQRRPRQWTRPDHRADRGHHAQRRRRQPRSRCRHLHAAAGPGHHRRLRVLRRQPGRPPERRRLRHPNVLVNLLDNTGVFITSTFTDSFGKYLFTNLNPGQYIVEFKAAGRLRLSSPQDVGPDDSIDSDANPATGRTGVYTLAAATST